MSNSQSSTSPKHPPVAVARAPVKSLGYHWGVHHPIFNTRNHRERTLYTSSNMAMYNPHNPLFTTIYKSCTAIKTYIYFGHFLAKKTPLPPGLLQDPLWQSIRWNQSPTCRTSSRRKWVSLYPWLRRPAGWNMQRKKQDVEKTDGRTRAETDLTMVFWPIYITYVCLHTAVLYSAQIWATKVVRCEEFVESLACWWWDE